MAAVKRALVTGINGFTGRYLAVALIEAGYEVHGTGVEPRGDSNYHCIQLADHEGLCEVVRQVDPHVVVHLAAIAFVAHADADAFYRVNLLGTRHLLSALAAGARSIEYVLLVSSANVYGNASSESIPEDTPPAPANDYAVSKLSMEYMARLWMDRLPITIVRPFNYTGIGQSTSYLLPKIVAHFKCRAATIELGNIDVARDFGDVRAVVAAYVGLIEKRVHNQIVNVCTGEGHTLREVVAQMEDITGHKIAVEVNPAFVRPNEVRILLGNPERLRSLIGRWMPPPLRETLEWMLLADG